MKKNLISLVAMFVLLNANVKAAGPCDTVTIMMNILNQTNVTCFGDDDGSAIVGGVGGYTPYTYDWVPGSLTGDTQTGLAPGTYYITVTDDSLCVGLDSVIITEPPVLDVTAVSTPATCGSADGTATANATGGAGGYSYSWFPIGGSNAAAVGLVPSSYTVTVTDANMCTDNFIISVGAVGGPIPSVATQTNVSCFGGNDGSATIGVSSGVAPYTFNWSPGGLTGNPETGLSAGTYTVTVTDNASCTGVIDVIITEPGELTLFPAGIVPSTCGASDGTAGVGVTGGTGPFTYSWNPTGGTGQTEPNVPAGLYAITVQDNNGCVNTLEVGVPDAIGPTVTLVSTTQPSCYGVNDGSIEVSASGGLAPYQYQWFPSGGNGAVANNLGGGVYNVLVTDDNGCIGLLAETLAEPNEIILNTTVVDEDCGENNGGVFVFASGGAGGLTYLWAPNFETSTSIVGLSVGTYSVTVTDFTGCSVTEDYTVNLLGNIPITATPTISIEQPGTEVQLNATGGVGYSWDPPINLDDPNISNPTATILFDTMYVVTGIDGAGCFGTDTVWVYLAEPCGDLFVPTIFSPNGDGLNENLCIIGNCVGTVDYKVFNRWGQLVFATTDQAICWDGTFKGKPVLEGVYAYTFSGTLPDGTKLVEKGSLTVVR